jgi:hypothetical protein
VDERAVVRPQAADPGPPLPLGRVVHESRQEVREIRMAADPGWLHLRLHLDHPVEGELRLGFDVVPGGAPRLPGSPAADGKSDYAIVLDLDGDAGQAYVRPALDPLALDSFPLPKGVVQAADRWHRTLLSTNRAMTVPTTGRKLPYETMNAGLLRRGTWDPAEDGFDSLATWEADGQDVIIRIPWLQIGIVDPSSHRALVPVTKPGWPDATGVLARTIELRVVPSRGAAATATLAWDEWNVVDARERLKAGHEVYAEAVREVSVDSSRT